jgi:hypothetical protein
LKITNDTQWVKFAEHVTRVGVELEIYVDRVQNKQSHVGTSSRSNVVSNGNENELDEDGNECENEDIFAAFDMARASNNIFPEIDEEENELDEEPEMGSEDEEEEEIYELNEEERVTRFRYTETGEMVSVGTFDDPPAAEFKDSSMWEYAINDVVSGRRVTERDDEILYKGNTFETKLELQSAVRAYSVKHHREIIVDHSSKKRYIVVCKLKDEGT